MKLFILLSVLCLSGCGGCMRGEAWLVGHAETCINGVVYYQFTSGTTVAYNRDGTVKSC